MSAQEGFAEPGGRDKGRSPALGPLAGSVTPLRLPYLDGMRALASGYVVLFHALPGFSLPYLEGPLRALRRAFAYGHEAVAIFIVLSGYCLMLPVLRKDPVGLRVALGPFVGRRAKRILPPYFAALALSLALLSLVPALRTPGTGTIWDDSLPGLDAGAISTHLLVIHNWFPSFGYQINGPLWSVASEWQIYFFFPLLLLPLWRRLGAVGALLGALVVGYAPLGLFPAPASVANPWYLLLFAFGMAAAAAGFGRRGSESRPIHGRGWGWVAAALWLSCLVLSNAFASRWFGLKPLVDPLVGLATATSLVALTQQAASNRRGLWLRLLESPLLVKLGHFSYSLYLTHLPVLACLYFALVRLNVTGSAFVALLAVGGGFASLVVAYGFHVLVERPFMRRD